MKLKSKVGKIKNIKIDGETQELEFTVLVTDAKFRKKLLRDLALAGNLYVEGDEVFFLEEGGVNAKL